jgi:glucose-1-phosphate cytidylyltransferase
MVEIGPNPILWHIMKTYASFGFREFVIALGYKGEFIKDFFLNYMYRSNNLTVSLANKQVQIHDRQGEDWIVHLLDTGANSQTGGRVRRVAEFIGNEPFMLTYGDGVCDLDLSQLVAFHKKQGKTATVTAVRPPARFGEIRFDGDLVTRFEEKPQIGEGWINGGFFVLEPSIIDYIEGDSTIFEYQPLEQLAAERQLAAYRHTGFWQCMDTLRDVRFLNTLWDEGNAPWKRWE